jgi:hypothetical protein
MNLLLCGNFISAFVKIMFYFLHDHLMPHLIYYSDGMTTENETLPGQKTDRGVRLQIELTKLSVSNAMGQKSLACCASLHLHYSQYSKAKMAGCRFHTDAVLGSQDSKAVPMRKWHQSGYSVAFCSIRK